MLVHAICHATGANLFNLTPNNTEGKYPGKKAYDMVYSVLKVAKALPPSALTPRVEGLVTECNRREG